MSPAGQCGSAQCKVRRGEITMQQKPLLVALLLQYLLQFWECNRLTNEPKEWVLEKAATERVSWISNDIQKNSRGFGHIIRKLRVCLEKEIIEGAMPGTRARGRWRTTWQDNIKMWTGLSSVEALRHGGSFTVEEDHSWRSKTSNFRRWLKARQCIIATAKWCSVERKWFH